MKSIISIILLCSLSSCISHKINNNLENIISKKWELYELKIKNNNKIKKLLNIEEPQYFIKSIWSLNKKNKNGYILLSNKTHNKINKRIILWYTLTNGHDKYFIIKDVTNKNPNNIKNGYLFKIKKINEQYMTLIQKYNNTNITYKLKNHNL